MISRRATGLAGWALAGALAAGSGLASDDTATVRSATEQVEVGDTAPAMVLDACDGTRYDLASLRGETRAVLVFFRGQW